jgi:hypothetical protein
VEVGRRTPWSDRTSSRPGARRRGAPGRSGGQATGGGLDKSLFYPVAEDVAEDLELRRLFVADDDRLKAARPDRAPQSVMREISRAALPLKYAMKSARFMQYTDSNVAREVGDLVGWSGPFWARRYSAIMVSDEERAQVDRLRYILAQGVKENLVKRVLDWPGVHTAGLSWRTSRSPATGSIAPRSTPPAIEARSTAV